MARELDYEWRLRLRMAERGILRASRSSPAGRVRHCPVGVIGLATDHRQSRAAEPPRSRRALRDPRLHTQRPQPTRSRRPARRGWSAARPPRRAQARSSPNAPASAARRRHETAECERARSAATRARRAMARSLAAASRRPRRCSCLPCCSARSADRSSAAAARVNITASRPAISTVLSFTSYTRSAVDHTQAFYYPTRRAAPRADAPLRRVRPRRAHRPSRSRPRA
jgi:hypothetical protein